jgi:hypothetical protein
MGLLPQSLWLLGSHIYVQCMYRLRGVEVSLKFVICEAWCRAVHNEEDVNFQI